MKIAVWCFWTVAGWCGIGLLGILLSLARGRRGEALKQAAWVVSVAGVYLTLLLAVSASQRQRVVAVGQDQCFGTMCFRVDGVQEVPGLTSGSSDKMIRLRIAVTNHGRSPDEESGIRAYVLDSQGRRWPPIPGVTGNRLTGRVGGGSEIVSQPIFRVPADATSLGLVLTHGSWQARRLIIGDSDSLAHRATIVPLGE